MQQETRRIIQFVMASCDGDGACVRAGRPASFLELLYNSKHPDIITRPPVLHFSSHLVAVAPQTN